MPPPRIPSLNWLRVFEAAARTGSFTRAAELLNMTPPAVSQQIKALEAYLQRPLFKRGPRNVQLTEAGRAFLPVVAQSLHSVEVATASLFGDKDRVTLTVLCSLLFANGWLARRLPDFHAQNTGIQLNLVTAIHEREFDRYSADLTILFGNPPDPTHESERLFGETIYPVAPPAIAEQIKRPEDMAMWPLIEVATHRANWFALLPEAGLTPRFTYADNSTTALAMAAQGAIALARTPACQGVPEQHGLVPCLPGLSIQGVQSYHLIYPARSGLSPAAQAFRGWLLDQVAESVAPEVS